MGGALAQLAAYGVADAYLTGSPEVTFFKSVYRQHSNFALEAIDQAFDGTADFGKKASVTLSRNGDLVTRIWLQVTLPDLYAYNVTASGVAAESPTVDVTAAANVKSTLKMIGGTADTPVSRTWFYDPLNLFNEETTTQWSSNIQVLAYERGGLAYGDQNCTNEIVSWPYLRPTLAGSTITGYAEPTVKLKWCNSIGHALLNSVELEIGGQKIDRLLPEWMDIWNELTEREEKQEGFCEMIGKYDDKEYYADTSPVRPRSARRTYFVPLIFTFNRHPGMAIPMIALTYHSVKLNFEFRSYLQCIDASHPITKLVSKADGVSLPAFQDVKLFAEYVFLDTPERRRFAETPHEYLIEQMQFLGDETVLENTGTKRFTLNFSQPVKEIVWVYTSKEATDGNRWFRYDVPGEFGAVLDNDSFVEANLKINGVDRIVIRPASYFRLVQPYQHHTRTPRKNVYVYSFALNPEDVQPSGSCNFSRVDPAHLVLTFDPATVKQGRLKIFAFSYNVLRIREGLAGLAFTNN
jgi:hypothetical protein